MTISTAYLFNRSVTGMDTLQKTIANAQNQLTTGKQLNNPSDNPNQTNAIEVVQSAVNAQSGYQSTIQQLTTRLNTQESAVQNTSDVLTRFKQLLLQANTSTASTQDRTSIATEMQSLRDQMLSAANTQDTNGNFVFSGAMGDTAAFSKGADGTTRYTGDSSALKVTIGQNSSITLHSTGNKIFTNAARMTPSGSTVPVGFFQSLDDAIKAVGTNNAGGMSTAIGEADTLQNGLTQSLSQIGTHLNTLSNQESNNESTNLQLKSTLSTLQDVDYTTTITKLTTDMTSLQAAQSSFAQMSKLSIFNYLN